MARYWRRLLRFTTQKVLHTEDTPHAVALGAALAMFVALLPLIGLQIVLALGLAALFRANKAICIPIVWITNPLTAVPIYLACFAVGRSVMATSSGANEESIAATLKELMSRSMLEWGFWTGLLEQGANLGLELWVGCGIVGGAAAFVTYFAARWGVRSYRERRRQRLLRRGLLRVTLKPGRIVRRSEPA